MFDIHFNSNSCSFLLKNNSLEQEAINHFSAIETIHFSELMMAIVLHISFIDVSMIHKIELFGCILCSNFY